jgi:hypothetical protein
VAVGIDQVSNHLVSDPLTEPWDEEKTVLFDEFAGRDWLDANCGTIQPKLNLAAIGQADLVSDVARDDKRPALSIVVFMVSSLPFAWLPNWWT